MLNDLLICWMYEWGCSRNDNDIEKCSMMIDQRERGENVRISKEVQFESSRNGLVREML